MAETTRDGIWVSFVKHLTDPCDSGASNGQQGALATFEATLTARRCGLRHQSALFDAIESEIEELGNERDACVERIESRGLKLVPEPDENETEEDIGDRYQHKLVGDRLQALEHNSNRWRNLSHRGHAVELLAVFEGFFQEFLVERIVENGFMLKLEHINGEKHLRSNPASDEFNKLTPEKRLTYNYKILSLCQVSFQNPYRVIKLYRRHCPWNAHASPDHAKANDRGANRPTSTVEESYAARDFLLLNVLRNSIVHANGKPIGEEYGKAVIETARSNLHHSVRREPNMDPPDADEILRAPPPPDSANAGRLAAGACKLDDLLESLNRYAVAFSAFVLNLQEQAINPDEVGRRFDEAHLFRFSA